MLVLKQPWWEEIWICCLQRHWDSVHGYTKITFYWLEIGITPEYPKHPTVLGLGLGLGLGVRVRD